MNRIFLNAVYLAAASLFVTGCIMDTSDVGTSSKAQTAMTETSDPNKASEPVRVAGGGPLGGYLEQFMDSNDKSKMVRALDGGLGKANRWKNPVSGAEFSVTPLSKAGGQGGGICRNYSISMVKSGISDSVNGTACIGDDGVWHAA
ncbi:MAG TPA: RT0821/Lpp0805 family surface protein [Gammaproteobacteria bacterium]|nr:RT0821/Lpp0805 family surface protein [Gammaproteobacteria bacterium]